MVLHLVDNSRADRDPEKFAAFFISHYLTAMPLPRRRFRFDRTSALVALNRRRDQIPSCEREGGGVTELHIISSSTPCLAGERVSEMSLWSSVDMTQRVDGSEYQCDNG
jgi:hypothetical protein